MRSLTAPPSEIINDTLSSVLDVPDKAFASTTWILPFSYYELTTSTVLLVCKAWLHVATPLLYHNVAQPPSLGPRHKHKYSRGRSRSTISCAVSPGSSASREGSATQSTTSLERPSLTEICISRSLSSSASIEGCLGRFKIVTPR
ncbi:hypothetical protein BKA70DRAFT_171229 [Coprinopsis sp. MPI-PUGE-AT-0042]|nr:hypothetical protein BKA70DRAFT_171229 [Coprinopsis sp. MPI-PUGE-AT-0042]